MSYEMRALAAFRVFDITKNLEEDELALLQKQIEEFIEKGSKKFVLHFIGINFLSSKTISSIIRIWKNVTERDGGLFLISAQSVVAELFRFCVSGNAIPIFDSVEQFEIKMGIGKSDHAHLGIRGRGEHKIIDVLKPVTVTAGFGELSEKLSELHARGHKHVALNMADSDTIYSEFAGLIKKWNWRFTNAGGSFGLINPNRTVRIRLSLMGLDKFVSIYDSEENLDKIPVHVSGQ